MASTSGVAPKPVMFKFQGIPSKSRFHDDYVEIKDTNLRHTNLREFLRICNKPTERSSMMFTLIHSRLVNIVSHLVSVQSTNLIMDLSQHFVLDERVVKGVTEEVVLDLQPDNIERVFHLPRVDQFIQLSYKTTER